MSKNNHLLPKYGMRPPEVANAFGSRAIFEQAVQEGFLKPVVNRHKCVIYDAGDVAQCWARIIAGELPNPKKEGITA